MQRPRDRLAALAFALGLTSASGCGGEAPTPAPTPAVATPAPATTPADKAEAAPAKPPPEPLTQEEIDLIAADPATLTPARRRERAFALRKKIMQNPDSAAAQSLEKVRLQVERGEITPQLPDRGLTLHANLPASSSTPAESAPAPAPSPAPAPAPSTPPSGSR